MSLTTETLDLIRAEMERQGVSTDELSRRIGRARNYAHRLLDGSRGLSLYNVERLGAALGMRARVTLHAPRTRKARR